MAIKSVSSLYFYTYTYIIYSSLFLYDIAFSTTYYVDPFKSSSGAGKTWNQAFTSLEEALITATKLRDVIYLRGPYTYKPSSTNRSACFIANHSLEIYGGFDGTESSESDRPTNNIDDYETILDGNNHCYHVLRYDKTLSLDRITIINGYANGEGIDSFGGGIVTLDSTKKTDLVLTDMKFINNTAINGGALWFESSDSNSVRVSITNCFFQNNHAINGIGYNQYQGGYGGAIYEYFLPNLTIKNTKFVGNSAEFRGGAIYTDYGAILTCDDCEFTSNTAGGYGGALFAEDRNSQTAGTFPVISASIFQSNTAKIYGLLCTVYFLSFCVIL